MKQTTEPLSFPRSLLVTALVSIWTLAFIVLLPYFIGSSTISPALWIHLSATLVMLLLIIRLGGNMTDTLLLYAIKFYWFMLAVLVGVIYWYIDHWLVDQIFNTNNSESIQSWQQANSNYHFFSVFISSVIMAPVFEELFFRGLIFRSLLKQFNCIFATIVSALLFALIHWSWPEFFSLFLVGLIYAVLAYKSNSVMTPLIAHLVHNLMTYFYYIQ